MKRIRISHSRPSYYTCTTGLKYIKKLSLRMQADLLKESKLLVPGEKIVFKLVNCFKEGFPGSSVAKKQSHRTVEVLRNEEQNNVWVVLLVIWLNN